MSTDKQGKGTPAGVAGGNIGGSGTGGAGFGGAGGGNIGGLSGDQSLVHPEHAVAPDATSTGRGGAADPDHPVASGKDGEGPAIGSGPGSL